MKREFINGFRIKEKLLGKKLELGKVSQRPEELCPLQKALLKWGGAHGSCFQRLDALSGSFPKV